MIKVFSLYAVILCLLLGCGTFKKHRKSQETISNKIPEIPVTDVGVPKTSPGTCRLVLQQFSIQTRNDNYFLIGTIENIVAVGAGFSSVLTKKQELKIMIDISQVQVLENRSTVDCTIREKMMMGEDYPQFVLLNINN